MSLESPLTPPTDNLYKFMAIGGFLLFVLSIFYADEWNKRAAEARIDEESSTYTRSHEILEIGSTCNTLLDQSKPLVVLYNTLPANAEEKKTISDQLNRIEADHKTQLDGFYKIIGDWNKAEETSMVANEEYKKNQKSTTLGIVLGIIMTIAGFYLWYVRVQRYQDLILRNEAGPNRRKT